MEFGPAKSCRKGKTEQHGIEQDEPRNRRVGVLEEDHQTDQPDSGSAKIEFAGGEICERDAYHAKEGVEKTHKCVIDVFRILLSRFKLEGSIVARQISRQADQHLPQGWMDVEVEFTLNIVGAKFSEAEGNSNQIQTKLREQRDWSLTGPRPM